jgi:hypothetical protein
MDMQQMMQQLLTKANQDLLTRMESDREQMLAEISATMDANTKGTIDTQKRMNANLMNFKKRH